MDTTIPQTTVDLLALGWELHVTGSSHSTRKFYVEIWRWDWANNGSRRTRKIFYAWDAMPIQAIKSATDKAISWVAS